jgi:hypothetical protein
MDGLEVGGKIFRFADNKAANIMASLADPNFGDSIADSLRRGVETTQMGVYWQLANNLVKDLTEPLKSIVNK